MALNPVPKSSSVVENKEGDFFFPIQERFHQLMEDFFEDFPFSLRSKFPKFSGRPYQASPAVNVSESEKEYIVSAEVPGLQEKDVDVSFSNNTLVVKGEKELSKEEKENGCVVMERSYGSFYRSIPFGTGVDENAIKASLKDGVLTIHVPKTLPAIKKTKKISVQKS